MQDRPSAASGPTARPRVFYGWWIVAAGGILNALAGGTYHSGLSVYFLPVTRDFGLNRAATSLAYGLARLEGGIVGPVTGYLVDRLGPRTMITVGGLIASLGFFLLALTPNFTTFLLVYVGVLALGVHVGFNNGIMAIERDLQPFSAKSHDTLRQDGNYKMIGDALGAYGMRVETPDQFIPALKKAIEVTESGQPALIECMVKAGFDFSKYP